MLFLIVNPTAGRGYAAQVAAKVKAELDARGIACKQLTTEKPGGAIALARTAAADAACEAVLSIGGDGTALEVASGVAGTGMPMGIIPAGTGNDFIKSVRLPKDPMEALEVALTGKPKPVDVVRINDGWFLNVCGTGFDVMVLDEVKKVSGHMRGLLPYLIGLLRAITHYHPVHVQCEVNGRTVEKDVLMLAVANGQYFGGGIRVCPEAQPNDGLLDMVMVDNVPRWRIPSYLPGLLTGKLLDFKETTHEKCTAITIRSKGMRIQLDGEIKSMDEARIAIEPGQVMLYR